MTSKCMALGAMLRQVYQAVGAGAGREAIHLLWTIPARFTGWDREPVARA
jgi:hypothetical protein